MRREVFDGTVSDECETTINVSRVANIHDRLSDRTEHKNRSAEFKTVQLSGNTLEGRLNPSTPTGHT